MIIKNAEFDKELFQGNCLCVFSIGYEQRSSHLLDKVSEFEHLPNMMLFAFDDYENHPHSKDKIKSIESHQQIIIQKYSDSRAVHKKILETVKKMTTSSDRLTVHIDYSSMPRGWYCKLPMLLQSVLRETDIVYFWYSEGEYPNSYEEYPSAGIDAFSFYSGRPSLEIEKNRVHILALGYDTIRTQAIISITDPDYLVACYAYNPKREFFAENIKQVNASFLSKAAMSVALQLDDFSFMVSKLCDLSHELLSTGDVILVPDGPKPLIFAISLVPDLLNKNGVTCLHVARNSNHFEAVDVTPTGIIDGFSIQGDL
ncbi:MAG: hypothetical protein ACOX0U_09165 [Oscillospiraceae bacterium]|jgi:hypothetical protein